MDAGDLFRKSMSSDNDETDIDNIFFENLPYKEEFHNTVREEKL